MPPAPESLRIRRDPYVPNRRTLPTLPELPARPFRGARVPRLRPRVRVARRLAQAETVDHLHPVALAGREPALAQARRERRHAAGRQAAALAPLRPIAVQGGHPRARNL